MRLKSAILLWLAMSFVFTTRARPATADVSFVHDIAPILLKRCTGCHGERINLAVCRRDFVSPD